MMAAPITVTGSTSNRARRWCSFPRASSAAAWTWTGSAVRVAPDGRFLINMVLDSAGAPITLLMNWNPEAAK